MNIWVLMGISIAGGLVLLCLIMFGVEMLMHKAKVRATQRLEDKRKKKEEKRKKKEAEKFCKVNLKNPYLAQLTAQYNIIVWGRLGSGKTIFANLLCHYLNMKYTKEDKRNRRYNKYMREDYVSDLKKLDNEGLLRVYSNIGIKEGEKVNSELWPYLTQQRRFIEKGIIFTDELGTSLGKDLYFSDAKNSVEVERIVEMSRYARQNCDVKWIGTEQSCDNIFKPIRDRGFTEIEALKTYVSISKWGKFKRFVLASSRLILPAFLTLNVRKVFEKQLFKKNKALTFLKLLLPAYFLLPRDYYVSKTKTYAKIKKKHTRFATLINFYDKPMLFKFSNKDIFEYNTRQNRAAYLRQFNKEGIRID